MKFDENDSREDQLAVAAYIEHLQSKCELIKTVALAVVPEANKQEEAPAIQRGKTRQMLNNMAKKCKMVGRINTLHSYDVFDHPDFLASKITEEKFTRFRLASKGGALTRNSSFDAVLKETRDAKEKEEREKCLE